MFPTMNLRSRGRGDEEEEEDKPSSYFLPSSSNDTYFTEQAFRAGLMRNDEIIRRRTELFLRNSDPVREAIVIELEKEKIKQDIMAAEIIRKRALDAEIRREIAMGRDLSIQRGGGFSSMLAEPRVPFAHHHRPNDSRFEERFSRFPSGPPPPEVGISERFSFQPQSEVIKRPIGKFGTC